ncbi:VanZ family protein [Actinomyces sp. zg328]|uniref:VanZ family protein n=1 Tax=Actinomyces sp. zg328 TaxID=2609287 RepID=UPI001F28B5BF|nr:VanZ family protein [Actinomyces sp. zg328]
MPVPMISRSSRVGAPSNIDPDSTEGLPHLGPDRLTTPRHAHRPGPRRRTARALAFLYGIAVLMAVLWPSGGDVASMKSFLGPPFLSEEGKDVALNLVMLAPLTAILTLAWPRVPWWAWALLGCLIGAGAEVAQEFIPSLERRPSLANIAQNAVGSWCGAAVGQMVARLVERRRRA